MEAKQSLFSLDGYELKIIKNDAQLTLEAEDTTRGKMYSIKLTNESISTISKELFTDIHTLHQVLLDFFQNKAKDLKFSMSADAKLAYSHEIMIGSVKKTFSFTIQLEEVPIDPSSRLERVVEKLVQKVSTIEAKLVNRVDENKLEKIEKALFEKLDAIVKRISVIEDKLSVQSNQILSQGIHRFNTASSNAHQFTFSNDNRTAQCKSFGYFTILSTTKLPQSADSRFSVKIDSASNSGMMIGIADQSFLNNDKFFQGNGVYAIWTTTAGIYYDFVSNLKTSVNSLKTGDILEFIINFSIFKIEIQANNAVIHSGSLNQTYKDYYPFVHFRNVDGKVTFL